jgi:hypothetical protein
VSSAGPEREAALVLRDRVGIGAWFVGLNNEELRLIGAWAQNAHSGGLYSLPQAFGRRARRYHADKLASYERMLSAYGLDCDVVYEANDSAEDNLIWPKLRSARVVTNVLEDCLGRRRRRGSTGKELDTWAERYLNDLFELVAAYRLRPQGGELAAALACAWQGSVADLVACVDALVA